LRSKEKSVINRPSRLIALCAAALLFAISSSGAFAQEKESKPAEKPAEPPAAPPKEESTITDHSIKIGSQTIPYKATVGSLLLKNEKDEPAALIFYTSYVRSDVKDLSQRPVAFLYNGGPGSSSLWLHMGSFGPKRVATINAGVTPPAPYTLEDNPNCLLDKADLVFIDPVGTGFSRAVGKAQDKDFWGVDQDARSLAQFIQSYVSRNNRWNSSKFLIGESYGTFRNAVLANVLQSRYTLYLNGLVMISSVWDLGTISFYPGEDLSYIVYLPSYAATAWYHKVLPDRPDNLSAFLDEASKFAKGEYADALLKGSALTDAEKSAVAKKYARFTGLGEDYVLKSNLRVKLFQFMQELQRSRGLTTGRLDARFSGPTYNLISDAADYDPQETAISGAFVAAFNQYVREELKYNPDREYHVFANFGDNNWDWKHSAGDGAFFPGSPNVMLDLANAMITNTHLQVEMEDGIYDLATPFTEAQYATEHLGLPANLQKNIHHKIYEAGHMMYLHDEDLSKLKSNVGAFLDSASKP
jgi:carboxypeptidase C (cathepsin A)